ncbi:hypothetical protein BJ165DRAFT_1514165 [Panaeolus papilionaceus]|nr:hypothetical protein BJ165DRAFT_1514165 [Panaeolus papilionaceus]
MSSTRRLLVDDIDSVITYNGNWFAVPPGQNNFGTPFQNTLHGVNGEGSVVLSFSGSSIQVYGNFDTGTSYGCFVDDESIGTAAPPPSPQGSWILCETNSLDASSFHSLRIQVKRSDGTFGLDFIQYIPSLNATSDHGFTWIDNPDPSIAYDGTWKPLDDIAAMTQTKGGKASVNFTGVSLTWFGYTPGNVPHSTMSGKFAVDGGAQQSFTFNGPADVKATLFNQVYFQTLNLSSGQHTMDVEFEGDDMVLPLTLDYLIVKNSASTNLNDPTASTSPSTSAAPTQATIGPSESPKKSTPLAVGGIVGGALGGLALLLLLVLLLYYLRRRRSRTNHKGTEAGSTTTQIASPYPVPVSSVQPTAGHVSSANLSEHSSSPLQTSGQHSTATRTGKFARERYTTRGVDSTRPSMTTPISTNAYDHSVDGRTQSGVSQVAAYASSESGTGAALSPSSENGSAISPNSASQQHFRHADSGIRLPRSREPGAMVELPPFYTSG